MKPLAPIRTGTVSLPPVSVCSLRAGEVPGIAGKRHGMDSCLEPRRSVSDRRRTAKQASPVPTRIPAPERTSQHLEDLMSPDVADGDARAARSRRNRPSPLEYLNQLQTRACTDLD